MLIIPPSQFRKRRRLKRTPPPPFHDGLRIIQVTPGSSPGLVVFFTSGEFVFDELNVPTAFMAMTSNGIMQPCDGVTTYNNDWMELEFPGTVALGAPWQLVGPIEGVTPAIAWPQAGVVTT